MKMSKAITLAIMAGGLSVAGCDEGSDVRKALASTDCALPREQLTAQEQEECDKRTAHGSAAGAARSSSGGGHSTFFWFWNSTAPSSPAVTAPVAGATAPHATTSTAPSASAVVRGGFGSTAAAHTGGAS